MNKLLIIALIIAISTSISIDSKGQNINHLETNSIFDTHYLGVNAGFLTGVGFSYRYWPAKSGFQITALPIYDKNRTIFSLGTSYLYEIKQYEYTRLLAFASNHFTNMTYDQRIVNNVGIGFGMDVFFQDIVLNLMVGYGAIDIFDDFKTLPTIEMGLFFNF